jgi:hypothetical protein
MGEEIQVATTNPEFDIIASQTGVEDLLVIERTFMECNNDTTKTILKLLNRLPEEAAPKEPSDIDVFRAILNEKDKIYHDIMSRKKE